VLERLVRSRVDRLSPAAQEAIRAASVLGFEFQVAQLAAMLDGRPRLNSAPGLNAPRLGGARTGTPDPVLSELVASDLIHHRQPRGPEPAYVFRHALIQEATYLGLLRAERRSWHARAAAAIEASPQGSSPETAAVVGRHYASAGDARRALRYLEIAGDHATDAFANDEAISSFRGALALTAGPDTAEDSTVRLYAKLANVLWRTGQYGETRKAFREALRIAESAGAVGALRQASLYTRLGRVSVSEGQFADAVTAFDAAEALLGADPGADPGAGPGADPAGQDDGVVDQWLELMIEGRADMFGIRGDANRALAVLDRVRPLVEARGTPARKTEFYRLVVLQRLARDGMSPTDDDIELLRRGLRFARQTGLDKDVAYAAHRLGFVLGLHGDLAEARENEEVAVETAERVGESVLLPAALTGLALIALRQHATGTARSALARVLAIMRESERDEDRAVRARAVVWERAATLMIAWLDQPREERGGREGRTRGEIALADELAAAIDFTSGTADPLLEPLPHLARGLTG
jgi:tetratricopeptide (TPR) repeat protein